MLRPADKSGVTPGLEEFAKRGILRTKRMPTRLKYLAGLLSDVGSLKTIKHNYYEWEGTP